MDHESRITMLRIVIVSVLICVVSSGKECPSVPYRAGVKISCSNPTEESVDCRNKKVPVGTLAQFRCEDFHVPVDGTISNHGGMRCNENGKWNPDGFFRSFACRLECDRFYGQYLKQSNLKDYEIAGIEYHNLYRRKHDAPPLLLSPELNIISQELAEESLRKNRYKFESATNWLALSGANLTSKSLVEEAIRDWYKTSSNYNYESPSYLPFTNIVWKRTTEIGIGVSQIGMKQLVVVKYNQPPIPKSQELKFFKENVIRPV